MAIYVERGVLLFDDSTDTLTRYILHETRKQVMEMKPVGGQYEFSASLEPEYNPELADTILPNVCYFLSVDKVGILTLIPFNINKCDTLCEDVTYIKDNLGDVSCASDTTDAVLSNGWEVIV